MVGLSLLIKPSHRVLPVGIMMVTAAVIVIVIAAMTVTVAVPLVVGEVVQVVEIALSVASPDILRGSALMNLVEVVVVGEGTARGMIGTAQRTTGTVGRMIGTAQRTTDTVQRTTGMVQKKTGMVVGIAMDLIAVGNALEDVAGMMAAVVVQEERGMAVLHTIAPEMAAFTRILLQRSNKWKVSAVGWLSCQVPS